MLLALALVLASCGSSARPDGASLPAASASTPAQASSEAAPPDTPAPQPTLVPTAASGSSASTPPSAAPASQPAASTPAASEAQPSPTAASANASAAPFGRTLQLAEPPIQGDDVRLVQQRLDELGYTQVGTSDGVYGPKTDAAVRAFQQINDLDVDGIVGPRTWERLFGSATPAAALAAVVSLPTGWLLGSSTGGRWLDVEPTVALLRGGEVYRIPGSQTVYSGEVPSTPEIPCETAYAVPLSPQTPDDFGVAVGGSFELQPRTVSQEDPSLQEYRSAVAMFLNAQGIAQPDVQIQQVLRADLDGDGSDELLLSATRFTAEPASSSVSPNVAAGDYSAVLLLSEGQSMPVAIESNVFPEAKEFIAPQRFLLVGVHDLNGDGSMEVVVDGAYYEGVYIGVYEVLAGEPKIVLGNGCGV